MGLSTYDELKAEIAAWTLKSNLGDRIDSFIDLTESEVNKVLSTFDMEVDSTVTVSSGTNTVALPADFEEMVELKHQTDPKGIKYTTIAALNDLYPINTTSRPIYYSLKAGSIVVAPTADDDYTFNITYKQTLPALTSSNTTNWMLDDYPAIYLYGCLMQAYFYLRNEVEASKYAAKFRGAVDDLIKSDRFKKSGAAPLVLNIGKALDY